MNQDILLACRPALVALVTAFAVLVLLLRFSPAKLKLSKLKVLHRCERGGVQSLAFVLTLPIFITIVVFIVQVSQLLVGMMVVNYASFAAARAASVWIPAQLDETWEPMNRIALMPEQSIDRDQHVSTIGIDENARLLSNKLRKIRMAAVMGCAGISPSRPLGLPTPTSDAAAALDVVRRAYPRLVPSSREIPATDSRLVNKVVYSDHHTYVVVEWRDTANNTTRSPTYNPRNHPDPEIIFDPQEVGWQDSITVYVVHRYALVSAAGRSLAGRLSGWSRLPLRVLRQLPADWADPTGLGGQPVVLIAGTTTITNEGLKPAQFQTLAQRSP